ncbi:acyltransferase [Spirulina sp. CS-785/01]|uniref:acyltransferase n=1 Tax=Spirulina sp. CS-785/01 TaxID=3021716 RepID=UPI00232B38E2|nr:acyltransferase [Spirulina sp. CS-785/01]MDB9313548.1 acyltransferase [Spirulina sp. CS-785/01]
MNYFIHSHAIVETQDIGKDTTIWAFVHILDNVKIGENCNICDHVFIENGVIIGNGVTIKTHVSLWNGVHIGDYCFIGPNVAFTNDLYPRSHRNPALKKRYFGTTEPTPEVIKNKPFFSPETDWFRQKTYIGEGASLGANSTIICGVTIGEYAMIAAGAVVTKEVRPFELVGGVPAKHLGWVDQEGCRIK